MATYPGAIPTLATVTGGPSGSVVSAADNNVPNAEIVAAATEFGLNPQSIDDTVTPGASPASVANVLDMFANIVKVNGGVSGWQKSAVPAKMIFFGNGAGATVPLSTTYYANQFGRGLNATEAYARMIMTYPGTFAVQSFWVETLTAQPATGSLLFALFKNGTYAYGWETQIGNSAAAGVYHIPIAILSIPTFAANDGVSLILQNADSASASAHIGAWSLVFTQVG